ncbi:MAG: DUF1573 domain-containing protein [Lentisphaeria bacterium]|nr:DUF1573 domain-containing protein [Lentisphaeria bacterium]
MRNTHAIIYFSVLFFAVAVCPVQAAETTAAKTPRLVCEKNIVDFGTKKTTESFKHTFIIYNTGKAVLRVKSLRLSCSGCFEAVIDKREIKPGECAKLETAVDLKESEGKVRKAVILTTNDPKRPIAWFRLTGKAEAVKK